MRQQNLGVQELELRKHYSYGDLESEIEVRYFRLA